MSESKPTPCAELAAALRANIADPTNVTWRRVLEALKVVEEAGDIKETSPVGA